MKARTKHLKYLFLLPALVAGLGLTLVGQVTAQTFTTLRSFAGASEGASPSISILSSNILYGTAGGGDSGNGTLFAISTDGTVFTNLHSFTTVSGTTNSDGASPQQGLVISSNTLYGKTHNGGSSGRGTVFKVNTDGTGFMILHAFTAGSGTPLTVTNSDGAYPYAGLVTSGNILYGTASRGGSSGRGTVFAVNIDGTGFTNLHNFTILQYDSSMGSSTNSDGANPKGGLVLTNNILYGTTQFGGSSGSGAVFAIGTDGTGFTNLHSFTLLSNPNSSSGSNTDGASPNGLILSGSTLYGTAAIGGSSGVGAVFAVNTNGTGFTNLHSFATSADFPTTNSDGTYPEVGLIISGATLYGTANYGGSSGNGTIFAIRVDGTDFSNLHNFTALPVFPYTNSDGTGPSAMILSGDTVYGAAGGGGSSGNGTVFSISFAPQLTITPSGTNVILTWPTNVAGFDYTGYTLQSTTNLVSTADWTTVSPAPVAVNGQNTITNPITGAQQFFRLKQ